MSDLLAVRELCVQIERTKESLSRQLASQSVSHDQSQEDMVGLIAERDLLKQQVLHNYYGYHLGNDDQMFKYKHSLLYSAILY